MGIIAASVAIEEGSADFPETIYSVVKKYADAYKRRDILHKQLAEMPEDNETATMEQRKLIADEIAELTDVMETLYPFYEAYWNDGAVPTEEELQPKQENTTTDVQEQPLQSKEDLQKKRKSIATKRSRAKNMLEFQTETKGKEPNPMPESPKRVKYQTKVENLTEELKEIDYQIAKLG